MVAPTPSLPELTDRESHLLAAFIALRFDIFALARNENLLPRELLAFTQSPAIEAHLAAFRHFAEEAFALRALQSRTAAIEQLEQVARTTEDPIEKRRAASTILRGLNPPRPPRTPTPRGTGLWPVPHSDSPISSDPQERRASAPHPGRRSQRAASPLPPSPPPEPTYTPTPTLSRGDLAAITTEALSDPTPTSLITLHAFLADGATINNSPAPELPEDFLAAAPTLLACTAPITTGDYQFDHGCPATDSDSCTITLNHDQEPPTRYRIEFSRAGEGPHRGCWQIKSITRLPADTS